MLEGGVIVNRTNETVLRRLPPYIISAKHVDLLIARLDQVLSSSTGFSPRREVRS